MHVQALTPLPVNEVMRRFAKASEAAGGERGLSFVTERRRPKFFLEAVPLAPRPAAEVAVSAQNQGSVVVLRLMWGPLPAPFPRALALIGIVLAVAVLARFQTGVVGMLTASMLALLPLFALICQRRGEYELRSRLSAILDGADFNPVSH